MHKGEIKSPILLPSQSHWEHFATPAFSIFFLPLFIYPKYLNIQFPSYFNVRIVESTYVTKAFLGSDALSQARLLPLAEVQPHCEFICVLSVCIFYLGIF